MHTAHAHTRCATPTRTHVELTQLPVRTMTLELFGFVKRSSSATAQSAGSVVDSDASTSAEPSTSESTRGPPTKRRRFNDAWSEGRMWLKYDGDSDAMYCEWCRRFDRNEHRNQFVKGCTSMKLESVKKHEGSRQHKDSEAAQRARSRPDLAPIELALQTMERQELEQMKRLFNTAFYLVVAERPFSRTAASSVIERSVSWHLVQ